jgi:sugar/nucleoside kinase (ribokinase family)
LLERGVELAVVKRGPAGVLCRGLLSDWPLRRTLEFANAAGAMAEYAQI